MSFLDQENQNAIACSSSADNLDIDDMPFWYIVKQLGAVDLTISYCQVTYQHFILPF